MSVSEFEAIGRPLRARDGSTYQAEVQRTPSTDGNWRWVIMRSNPPNTVPMASPVAEGSAKSRQAAESRAREALASLVKG